MIATLDEAPRAPWRWWLAAPAAASLVVAALVTGQVFIGVGLPTAVPARGTDLSALIAPAFDRSRLAWDLAAAAEAVPRVAAPEAPALPAAEAAWFAAALQPIPTPGLDVATVTQPEPVAVALLRVEALVARPVSVAPLDTGRDRRLP